MIPDPTGRARGRRDNGLVANSWSAVDDVDPRVGEHLLDVLALDGIAAYLQPTIDHDAVTRAVSLPKRPTDRLYVDRYRAAEARALVAAEAASSPPAQDDIDEEAVWAGIVASFERPSASVAPPLPAAPVEQAPVEVPWVDDAAAADETEEEEEEGYVPPPPPPLPQVSRQTAGALLTIAAGIFLLVLGSRLLGLDTEVAFRLGILSIVGAVGYLIWRMRDDRSDDDRPDDGAVV